MPKDVRGAIKPPSMRRMLSDILAKIEQLEDAHNSANLARSQSSDLALLSKVIVDLELKLSVLQRENQRLSDQVLQKTHELKSLNFNASISNAEQRNLPPNYSLSNDLARLSVAYVETENLSRIKERQISGLLLKLNLIERDLFWRLTKPCRLIYELIFQRRLIRIAIRESGYFDAEWYVSRYPDVLNSNFDPLEHFLKFGASEGRDPSNRFSTQKYLEENPDVLSSGQNALVHFVFHGQIEGRSLD